ncbi:MAG: hypothetical protein Kow00129_09920 [Thermoleophilia bacterium]
MTELAVRMSLLAPDDLDQLLAFEKDNRSWFEKWVPPRPPEYYESETLTRLLDDLLAEQRAGSARFYLVRLSAGNLVARVNLVKSRQEDGVARLGYRVAAAATGRGIASTAVALAVAGAFSGWGASRIEASTVVGNAASAKVLEKNGFRVIRRERGGLELHGRRLDRLDYVLDRGR